MELPYLFNVETIGVAEAVKGDFAAVHPKAVTPGVVHGGKASVAYLIPWGTQAAGRFLAAAERENIGSEFG